MFDRIHPEGRACQVFLGRLYKHYKKECIEIIDFIKLGKSLGFSLNEIKLYYSLIFHKKNNSKDIKNILTNKVEQINEKVNELNNIKLKLNEIIKSLNCPDLH